jgi:hypothetical protein
MAGLTLSDDAAGDKRPGAQVVDEFIEPCWGDGVPELAGNKGRSLELLNTLHGRKWLWPRAY